MRSTLKISNSTSLHYLQMNYSRMERVNSQISLQKQMVNVEDDPIGATLGLRLLNVTARTEQYSRNIQVGIGLLGLTDKSLQSSKTILDSVRALAVGGANDVTTPEQRTALQAELISTLKQLISASNGSDGERYIFGGQNTTVPPFTIVNGRYVNYQGDDKNIDIQTDAGVLQAINCTGAAAYGNMDTIIASRDLNPDITLATDSSTRLSDLNGGEGIPKGKITVYYSAYPDGLEVDLSGCDTLEDVKDAIEKQTLDASRKLDATEHYWLDKSNLNWHDLQDRFLKVTMNPEHNGISLQEFDLGEPLPAPTKYEAYYNLNYDNFAGTAPGYAVGLYGMAGVTEPDEPLTIFDQLDYVYAKGTKYYDAFRIDDAGLNRVAEGLGIKGTAKKFDPLQPPDPILDGFLHGRDLNPALSDRTLLADLTGYNDAVYTFSNGSKPQDITIQETSKDDNHIFNDWNLTGLTLGANTGPNGELYTQVTRRGPPDNDLFVEIYTVPIAKAKPSDLVATGSYNEDGLGGTIRLEEANSSGVGGTVGIVLSTSSNFANVNLMVDFGSQLTASVHVPSFIEETDLDGASRDIFSIASGWQIRGLDMPPASGYDKNHPATTDLDGDVSVNYRYIEEGTPPDLRNILRVELFRPSFADQPATMIASGDLDITDCLYTDPVTGVTSANFAASGRVEIVGLPDFSQVKGSVYLEIPAGTSFTGSTMGSGINDPTQLTFSVEAPGEAPAGELVLGGAMEMVADTAVAVPFVLKNDTLFLKGQVFDVDIPLAGGGWIPAGTALYEDTLIPRGVTIDLGANLLLEKTVLTEGQTIEFSNALVLGTVIPRGTYYTGGGPFTVTNMGITVTNPIGPAVTTSSPYGHDLRATFATIEDFNRAVREAGVYVESRVAENGKSLEFISTLAGAYLTVSEDSDCYEQMNDQYQQLSRLNLDGLVKGESTDTYGNVYTEVIYYPPDPQYPDRPLTLVNAEGKDFQLEPGYYVRVYSDKDALKLPWEDRDNSSMVAEGFIPAGSWNPAFDRTQMVLPFTDPPFLPDLDSGPILGFRNGLVLEERNNSGVSGTVDVNYYAEVPSTSGQVGVEIRTRKNTATGVDEDYQEYNPWVNDNITVFPGGLRPEGSRHTTIQEWDLINIIPGVTCDYSGTYHGSIARDGVNLDVRLHRDSSHLVVTSRNDPTEPLLPGNVVQLYETNPDGQFILVDGLRVPAGTLVVEANNLPDQVKDNFVLTTGAIRQYGQEREENVFSTINDLLDALAANDAGKIHDLIGSIQNDIERMLTADGDVSTRAQRMELVMARQQDDLIFYKDAVTQRVGMDTNALSAAILRQYASQNAYDASLSVASKLQGMSLLDYL
ncbi:MAG: flagellar hook-associated protein FlgL [Planctomycetota bacterium]|jgi:flagellin-like hook-associated protein FlgL|nr:flagellar hook-associated protein FlgL [Planctomycetota bacterium]